MADQVGARLGLGTSVRRFDIVSELMVAAAVVWLTLYIHGQQHAISDCDISETKTYKTNTGTEKKFILFPISEATMVADEANEAIGNCRWTICSCAVVCLALPAITLVYAGCSFAFCSLLLPLPLNPKLCIARQAAEAWVWKRFKWRLNLSRS